MKFDLIKILKIIALPLIILFTFVSLEFIVKIFGLPPRDEILKIVGDFVDSYGMIVIFIAAIIEGLLLVGNYFPGGAVIFVGVISATGNIPKAVIVVLIVCAAFSISYTTNYILGRYGWYRLLIRFGMGGSVESMKGKLSKHVFTAVLSSYWLPNMASICSTTAGIMHIPWKKFTAYSTVGILFWNTFWGTFVYITGDALLKLNIFYISMVLLAWCAVIVAKMYFVDRKSVQVM